MTEVHASEAAGHTAGTTETSSKVPAASDTRPRFARLRAATGVLAARVVAHVRRQLDPDDPGTVAGYFSGAADTLTLRRVLLAFAVCALAGIGVAYKPGTAPFGVQSSVMLLYVAALAALIPVHRSPDRRVLLGGIACAVAVGAALTFTYADALSAAIFALLAIVLVFRLPWRLSLPALGMIGGVYLLLLLAHAVLQHPRSVPTPFAAVGYGLGTFGIGAVAAIATRSRAQVLRRLRDTEKQLRAEMETAAALAAARERARIARDMHDVLAHSLTVLSIQTQAARQVAVQDPERAATILDDIARVLKESITESRRLVGVLREAERGGADDSPLGARLLSVADRFAERTGMRCAVRESGAPRPVSEGAEEALRFALQEALTNAYRHGAAHQVRAALSWEPAAVMLTVRDDGTGAAAEPEARGTGNGMRGMRERAAALGGGLRAGPLEGGGYEVAMTLPLAPPSGAP